MKTIRQIADELGVSKQSVYKRFKGKLYTVCAPYSHTEQGTVYIDEQGETLIKQDFLRGDRSNGVYTECSIGTGAEQAQQADLVSVLQATIDTLQDQLEVKDRQIEQQAQTITRITDALVTAQQAAIAAQAFHTGTMPRQLFSGEERVDQQNQEYKQKCGWIGRLFGR